MIDSGYLSELIYLSDTEMTVYRRQGDTMASSLVALARESFAEQR